MTEIDVTSYILQLFEHHGLNCTVHNDWVLPNSELPALRAFWSQGTNAVTLEIQVLVREGVLIQECFGGFGQGNVGLRDALAGFALNMFHGLLAGLWRKNDPNHVDTENVSVNGKDYVAYTANFLTRNSEGVSPHIPERLFDTIIATIKCEPLGADFHWFRFYFANIANNFTFEALKDNDEWEAGVDCLKTVAWTPNDGYYSVRLFLLLRAADAI